MPGLYVCPFCGSSKVSKEEDDAQYYCDDCCEFFDEPKEIFSDITSTPKKEKEKMPKTKPKPRECVNCGRIKTILGDGLCPGCYCSVHNKFEKGTSEYSQALANAKNRFSNPDHKQTHPEKSKTRKLDPEKMKDGMERLRTKARKLSLEKVQEAKAHVNALKIKYEGGNPDTASIIGVIDERISFHEAMIERLVKAKAILVV